IEICHKAMHTVARDIKLPSKKNLADVLARIPDGDCSAGLLHGLVDRFLQSADSNGMSVVGALCRKLGSDNATAAGNCRHGAGHGLRRLKSTEQALSLCESSF